MSEQLRRFILQKMVEAFDAFDSSTTSGRPVMIAVRLQKSYDAATDARDNSDSKPNLQEYLAGLVSEIDGLRRHHVDLGIVPDELLREIFVPWPEQQG